MSLKTGIGGRPWKLSSLSSRHPASRGYFVGIHPLLPHPDRSGPHFGIEVFSSFVPLPAHRQAFRRPVLVAGLPHPKTLIFRRKEPLFPVPCTRSESSERPLPIPRNRGTDPECSHHYERTRIFPRSLFSRTNPHTQV